MNFFSLEHINTFRKSGTIAPSSKSLINKCLKEINFEENQVIIEFGIGNGCITEEILKRMKQNSKILCFEINEKFCEQCQDKFSKYKNIEVINSSALNFPDILQEKGIVKVDFFISSLPLSMLKNKDVKELFVKVNTYLKRQGAYVQYQYSLDKHKLMKDNFREVNIDFTWLNLPPAFVYNCKV